MDGQADNKASNINIDISAAAPSNAAGEPQLASLNLDSANKNSSVGLTKDELMKYANQPFWVRLRNILFASFWIVWLSILVAAIGYVINTPGCTMVSAAATNGTASTAGQQLAASTPATA